MINNPILVKKPTGSVSITSNGSHSVSWKETANVNVPNTYSNSDEGKVVHNSQLVAQTSRSVSANGTYDTTQNNSVDVQVPQPSGSLSITSNGSFNVTNYATADVHVVPAYISDFYGVNNGSVPRTIKFNLVNWTSSNELCILLSSSSEGLPVMRPIWADNNSLGQSASQGGWYPSMKQLVVDAGQNYTGVAITMRAGSTGAVTNLLISITTSGVIRQYQFSNAVTLNIGNINTINFTADGYLEINGVRINQANVVAKFERQYQNKTYTSDWWEIVDASSNKWLTRTYTIGGLSECQDILSGSTRSYQPNPNVGNLNFYTGVCSGWCTGFTQTTNFTSGPPYSATGNYSPLAVSASEWLLQSTLKDFLNLSYLSIGVAPYNNASPYCISSFDVS